MTNGQKILEYLRRNAPNSFSNADLVNRTGVRPHNQVFQITQKLMSAGEINGRLFGKDWLFWCDTATTRPIAKLPVEREAPEIGTNQPNVWREFEVLARATMSRFYNTVLREGTIEGVPKRFDLVSEDFRIVGDAKCYSLVGGAGYPPAKMATISEHVWLLEKTKADSKFLVFGNQRQVPVEWLTRYGSLVVGIDFYFLSNDGALSKLP